MTIQILWVHVISAPLWYNAMEQLFKLFLNRNSGFFRFQVCMQLENFQSYSKQFQNWNWFTKANVFVVCTNWHGIIIRLIKIIENLKLRIIEITSGFRNIFWAKKQKIGRIFQFLSLQYPKNILHFWFGSKTKVLPYVIVGD